MNTLFCFLDIAYHTSQNIIVFDDNAVVMERRKYLTAIGLAGLGSTIAGCSDTEESDLEVTVENSEGEPLDNAQVELVQKSEDSSNDETVSIELTNSDGRLSIEELEEGETYTLVASQEGYSEETSEEFEFEGNQLEATLSLSEVEESPDETPEESPDETPEASGIFEVQVDPTDVTVEKGNELGLEIRLTNTGDGPATQEFQVSIGDETSTIEQVQLDAGEEYEYTPTFDTSDWETGDYDITFYTDDDEASVSVTIEEDGEANVVLGEAEYDIFDIQTGDEPGITVPVQNIGESDSGEAEITVEWVNDDGEFLGSDRKTINTLKTNETWLARVISWNTADHEEVADFDYFGDYSITTPKVVDSLSVDSLRFDRENVRLNVGVEYQEGSIPSRVRAIGRLFDGEGRLIGDTSTTESDIPTNRPWRFDITFLGSIRNFRSDIEDYEVIIVED